MTSKIMDNILEIKRKVIKHENFKFTIEDPKENDPDYCIKMKNFSIKTIIYYQEWVGWNDSPSKPNRKIEIIESPYYFFDYISPSTYKYYNSIAEDYVKCFEKGLSPACMKYNYSPSKTSDFQRTITWKKIINKNTNVYRSRR